MNKISREEIKHFKKMMFETIFDSLTLSKYYKYDINIKLEYNYKDKYYLINIIVTTLYKESSIASNYYNFNFLDGYLRRYEKVYLWNDGYIEYKPVENNDLSFINLIVNRVKEFIHNYE